jgi:hypothetical protein
MLIDALEGCLRQAGGWELEVVKVEQHNISMEPCLRTSIQGGSNEAGSIHLLACRLGVDADGSCTIPQLVIVVVGEHMTRSRNL